MFKRLMYEKVVEVLNLNTQKIYSTGKVETDLTFEGGYLLGLYNSGIPYAVKQLDITTKYSFDRVEIIPVSEELSQETPSVNKSDRSDYTFRYQIMFRSDNATIIESALDEFREYFFTNKQFELDGYDVSIKTTRADKLPQVGIDAGQFYNFYAFTVYATAIKNGYMKKVTDIWEMALDSGFGNTVVATSLVVGKPYEIDSLGTTDWNVVYGTEDITYSIGDSGLCVEVGTGTGEASNTYQELTLTTDTYSTIANVISSNATEIVKASPTVISGSSQLKVVYNGSYLEKLLYSWIMTKEDMNTTFRFKHTFDGEEFSYEDCILVRGVRTLLDNGVVFMEIDWTEED